METSVDTSAFRALGSVTHKLVAHLRARSTEPEERKVLKKGWSNVEAATLLGVSDSYLRRLVREDDKGIYPRGVLKGNRRSFSLAEINCFRHLMKRLPWRDPRTDKCFRVVCSNFKGGTGKTTVSTNLSTHFALQGYRVLHIDLDPQGSSTALLYPDNRIDVHQDDTIYASLMENPTRLANVILPTAWENLALVPAALGLYAAELELPRLEKSQPGFHFWSRLDKALATVEQDFDIIVLDTPPALSHLTLNAVWAAHGILVPVLASMMDLQAMASFFEGMAESFQMLESVSGQEKRFDFLRIVISNYQGNPRRHVDEHITAGRMRKVYAEYVLDEVVIHSPAIQRAASKIRILYELDPLGYDRTYQKAVESIAGMGAEIINLIQSTWPSKQLQKEISA